MTGLLVEVAIMATAAEPALDMTVPFDSTADAPRNTCNPQFDSLMSAQFLFLCYASCRLCHLTALLTPLETPATKNVFLVVCSFCLLC